MAHNSNSHDAPWLPNSQTEMFSVYAGNTRSSCLVVGAVANCSTHGDQCPSRVGRRQPGVQVSDMQPCSRLVDAAPA